MAFTLQDKLAELRRELVLRRNVYPWMVRSGRLKQADADRQIGILREIIRDYERMMQIEPGDSLWDEHVKNDDFTIEAAGQPDLFGF